MTKKVAKLSPNAKKKKILFDLGQNLRRVRKIIRMSQEDMAKLLEVHQTALSRIENGLQSLEPWQIAQFSEFVGIRIDSFYSGCINYWSLAEKFGQAPPSPKKYRELPFSKLREVLPILSFVSESKGQQYTQKLLNALDIDGALFKDPDQPIGSHCEFDLLRNLISNKVLAPQSLGKLADQTRLESVQGYLHLIYQAQTSPLSLLKSFVLNSSQYETNFHYVLREENSSSLELSVSPGEHMKDVSYKDETSQDFLCKYKQAYLSSLPKYIGARPLQVIEKDCHYHGAAQCTYRLR